MTQKNEGAPESMNESPTSSDGAPKLTQAGSRDVLTEADLNALRASLHAEVARTKDQFMRSHISNLAEVIENYLKADGEHRRVLKRQLLAALVRLESYRAKQQ